MQIIALASDEQILEISSKKINTHIEIKFEKSFSKLLQYKSADAFLILNYEANIDELKTLGSKPVFINSVESTLKELLLPENISRINGWATFLKREKWEVVAGNEKIIKNIFNQLEWQYVLVKDEPGLIAARVLSMIINEAYYTLGENVSTKNEIDIAMKLGTNYPYGPFEWSEKIGLKKIYSLLKKLGKNDIRYNIAPAMEAEINLSD